MSGNGIFESTVLAEVEEVLAKKQFDNLTLGPIEEGEEVVGDMTELEKAVFALTTKKTDEHNQMVNPHEDEVSDEKKETLSRLRNQVEVLRSLGWQIIQDRLNLNRANVGIREGYKIVKIGETGLTGIVRRSSVTIIGLGGGFPGFPG